MSENMIWVFFRTSFLRQQILHKNFVYNTLKRLSIWHFWETLKKPFLVAPSTKLQETVILGKKQYVKHTGGKTFFF